MRNNNRAIVGKIIRKSLLANKKRNFFIGAAVVLTAFMVTSVFSAGISGLQTLRINPFRFEGTLTHMAMPISDPTQLQALDELEYVRNFGMMGHVAHAHMDDICGLMIFIDENIWRNFVTPVFSRVVGRHSAGTYDIMLSRHKLHMLDIENPYIGMEIPLTFTVIGDDSPLTRTFTLAAMYTEYVSIMRGAATPIFVSPAFAQAYQLEHPDALSVQLIFRNRARAMGYAERLAHDMNLPDYWRTWVHPAVLRDVNPQNTYIVMGAVIAFLMLTGFLLIYNVMYISVSKDVRFYGLLKTLGTTPRQLRRIVNGQVFWLYVIGMPVGLALAAALSFVIVPIVFEAAGGVIISFSPIIFVGGAVFTFITAWLGAFTSARKAARVSPVEAVSYVGKIVKVRRSAKGSPARMAFRNVFRERKRVVIVLVSLFLGVCVFTISMTFANSISVDNYLDALYDHDFTIGTREMSGFTAREISQIASIPGVAEVRQDVLTTGIVTYSDGLSEYVNLLTELRLTQPFLPQIDMENINRNGLMFMVRGIDMAWFTEWNNRQEAPFTEAEVAAFARGEMVLVSDRQFHWSYDVAPDEIPNTILAGTNLEIAIGFDETDESFLTTVPVGGKVDAFHSRAHNRFSVSFGETHTTMTDLFMSAEFLQEVLGEGLRVPHLHINVQSGMDSEVNSALYAMFDVSITKSSRYEARAQMEAARRNIFMLGSGISAILGAISIFNFTNVISVGMLVRKREFAALESVGMSRRQVRAMVRWEGAFYWGATLLVAVTIGNYIAIWLLSLLRDTGEPQFATLSYPFVPIIMVYAAIIIICSITPEIAYKNISRASLVERLREVE